MKDVEGADETAREIERRGWHRPTAHFDAASPDAGSTVDELATQLGGLGVLVNVAGTGQSETALDLPSQRVAARTGDRPPTGPFLCAQRAARWMMAHGHGGRIINVTSVHEHVPRLGSVAYCAAKADSAW